MVDFEEDFFQRIKEIHFPAGDWCFISTYQGILSDGAATSDITFPQFAGGTPGWSMVDAGFLKPWPHAFTAAEVGVAPTPLAAGGNLKISRFGVKNINPGGAAPEQSQISYSTSNIEITGYSNDTAVFFKSPASKFQVKHAMSSSRITGFATVCLYIVKPQTRVKAGVNPPLTFPCPASWPSTQMACADYNGGHPDGSCTFEVDIRAGTVRIVGLTGTARS